MVNNANFLEKRVQFFIFTTPVSLHSFYFALELSFNKILKIKKDLINIRLLLKEIYPNIFAKIINEAYIIFMSTN